MGDPGKLVVLDKAHEVLALVNEAVRGIHQPHLGDLKKQLMKTALSVASNIAEGRRRETQSEFFSFLDFVLGSNGELETQLRAAENCRAIPVERLSDLKKPRRRSRQDVDRPKKANH